jgi:hypothetical protein
METSRTRGGSRNRRESAVLMWMMHGGLGLTIIAVGMQMMRINGGFVTNYVADIGGPMWLYGAIRLRKTLLRRLYRPTPSPELVAVFVFLVGTVWEVCQAFDLSGTVFTITRGRFDPWDIAAYAASLAACVAIDRWAARSPNPSTLPEG